jgi:uncharacterized protein with PQ loop repeat
MVDTEVKLKSLGFLASFTGSIALIPKIMETYYNRSSEGINTTWLLTTFTSSSLWLTYAYVNGIIPSIVSSLFVFLSTIILYIMKLKFKDKNKEENKKINYQQNERLNLKN